MTLFTLVSRTSGAWGAELAGLEAVVATDGARMLVLGDAPAARGYAARAGRYFRPGDPMTALDQFCRRAVSSYMQASPPRRLDAPLDAAAAELSGRFGVP